MTDLRQAAQQALEAFEHEARTGNDDAYRAEREALRAALAEPQTTHWEGCEAVHPECRAKTELERKSDAIQRLWKERDELRALNAELVEALRRLIDMDVAYRRGPVVEEAVEKARAALAKVEANK
jgi:hypothetical protein